jgi:hypothetical protein
MPRFFVDVHDGDAQVRDEDGQEFANLKAVRRDAVLALSELARGLPRAAGDQHDIIVGVRDETGKSVLTATLSLVVRWAD